MELAEHFERSGNWLFRWRSYLPLLLYGVVLLGVYGRPYPGGSRVLDPGWGVVCLGVGLVGVLIRALTVGHVPAGTSGRTTWGQEAESLNTTGMYSVVRHPLYLGNYFMWLGVSLLPRVWWVPVLVSLAFWLYYERIIYSEEEFLRRKFGDAFRAWARRTPAFIPSPRRWVPPALSFSLRTVLKREHSGVFGLVSGITVFEVVEAWVVTGRFQVDRFWAVVFALTAVLYLTLLFLKKKTRVLSVPGR